LCLFSIENRERGIGIESSYDDDGNDDDDDNDDDDNDDNNENEDVHDVG